MVPLALDPYGSVFVVFRGGKLQSAGSRDFNSARQAWKFPASRLDRYANIQFSTKAWT